MSEKHLEKLLDFIQEYLKYKDRELLKMYILEHEKYGTIDYAIDDRENIIGLCRWNMSDDGKVGNILDLIIKEEWRSQGLGKDFILRALKKFPDAERLRFKRGIRGEDNFRELNIKGIIKRNIF